MPKPTNAEREAKARQKFIDLLCQINDTDPMMGSKWREGMLKFYSERLAELMLRQKGSDKPDQFVIELLAHELRSNLET
jgi:hypothetical protein